MKANETKVDKFLAKTDTTFTIPVYQRNYDWTLVQCRQLLLDIIQTGNNDEINAHFIGSIVYIHDDIYTASGITELTIIDGQQRLTTITLIYIALYRLAKKINNDKLMNRIHKTYLINEFAPETEKLKLKPTENNKAALKHILNLESVDDFKGYSRIVENFNFFETQINAENFEVIQRGLTKLIFIDIALERQKDNPQRIFESLNSTGLELSQADLIRNYILMGLPRKNQENIYNTYWKFIEKLAKDEISNSSKVSDFIRDFLTLENKKIPNKKKVYEEFKKKYPTSSIENLEIYLSQLKRMVRHYNKLINPSNEVDKDIKIELKYIKRLEINVSYPFLMKVYDDFSANIIDKNTFIEVLKLVQSYTWRRFIVGFGTEGRNKIFMTLYDKVKGGDNYLFQVEEALVNLKGKSRFPRNKEVIEALKLKDVYNIQSKNRTYLLERLENHKNREPVIIETNPDITIEHIFPQNPDPKWRIELGQGEYDFIKENYLNILGNLTLSGNNGKLGNKPFVDKRDMNTDGKEQGYRYSRLWLNRDLKEKTSWSKKEIEERIQITSDRFLKIWEFPDIELELEAANTEINIFDAEEPTHKKLEYAIFFDQKLEIKNVTQLYLEVFQQLFDLQPETFFTTEIGQKLSLTKNKDEVGLRQAAQLNDTYFVEVNIDNVSKFNRIKQALSIFGFEDELVIKYANRD